MDTNSLRLPAGNSRGGLGLGVNIYMENLRVLLDGSAAKFEEIQMTAQAAIDAIRNVDQDLNPPAGVGEIINTAHRGAQAARTRITLRNIATSKFPLLRTIEHYYNVVEAARESQYRP